MASSLRQIFVNVRLGTAQMIADTKKVNKAFTKLGKDLQRSGKTLTRNFTLPIAGAFTGAIASAAKFESAFAGVTKTVDGTDAELEGLRKGILNMSLSMPLAARDIAEVAAVAGQLGVKVGDVLPFTEAMVKLGEASDDMNAAEAANELALFTNVTGTSRSEIAQLANVVVKLGGNVAGAEGKILRMAGEIKGSAANAGFADQAILGLSAALVDVGLRAEGGGTAISKLIDKFQLAIETGHNFDKFNAIFQSVGSNLKTAFEEDGAKALQIFFGALNNVKDGGGSVLKILGDLGLTEVRLAKAIKVSTSSHKKFGETLEIANKARTNTAQLDKEFAERNKTFIAAIGRLSNAWTVTSDILFQQVKPALEAVLTKLADALKWWRELPEPLQKATIKMAGFVAIIGPAIVALGLLITAVGTLAGTFGLGALIAAGALAFATFSDDEWWKPFWKGIDYLNKKIDAILKPLEDLGKAFGKMADLVGKKIGELLGPLKDLGKGFEDAADAAASAWGFLTLSLKTGAPISQLKALARSQEEARKKAKELEAELTRQKGLKELQAQLPDVTKKTKEATEALGDQSKGLTAGATKAGKALGISGMAGGGKEAAKAVAELAKQLQKVRDDLVTKEFSKAFDAALEEGNFDAAKRIQEDWSVAVKSGVLNGLSESVAKGGAQAQAIAEQIATATAKETSEELTERIEETQTALAKDLVDKQKAAYDESIAFWRSTFENAITGVKFDLKDALKQVAVGFAAQIAQATLGGIHVAFKGLNNPKDFGGAIANLIIGGKSISSTIAGEIDAGVGSSTLDSLGSALGIEGLQGLFSGGVNPGSIGEAIQIGLGNVQGPLTQAQSVLSTAGSVLGVATAAFNNIDAFKDFGDSTESTTAALGTAVGTAIGASLGGPIGAGIGSTIGKVAGEFLGGIFGSEGHPETLARDEAIAKLNVILGQLGGIVANGQNVGSFSGLGDSAFDQGKAFQMFGEEFGEDALLAFSTIGESIEGLLELTEDVGGQIGVIIGENLGGDVNGLRELVNGLGISVKEIEDAWVLMGKKGEKSWHEVEVALQTVHGALGPGLKGVGAFTEAFQRLLSGAARGQGALERLKNISLEAQEAGLTSLQALEQKLIDSGQFTESEITALFAALNQRGITSLEGLAGASDRVLGGVVADLVSFGVEFEKALAPAVAAGDALANIPDITNKTVNFTINTRLSEDTKKAINAGIFEGGSNNSLTLASRGGPQVLAARGIDPFAAFPFLVTPEGNYGGERNPPYVPPPPLPENFPDLPTNFLEDMKSATNSIVAGVAMFDAHHSIITGQLDSLEALNQTHTNELIALNNEIAGPGSGGLFNKTVINIDARGAMEGVSREIMDALTETVDPFNGSIGARG